MKKSTPLEDQRIRSKFHHIIVSIHGSENHVRTTINSFQLYRCEKYIEMNFIVWVKSKNMVKVIVQIPDRWKNSCRVKIWNRSKLLGKENINLLDVYSINDFIEKVVCH